MLFRSRSIRMRILEEAAPVRSTQPPVPRSIRMRTLEEGREKFVALVRALRSDARNHEAFFEKKELKLLNDQIWRATLWSYKNGQASETECERRYAALVDATGPAVGRLNRALRVAEQEEAARLAAREALFDCLGKINHVIKDRHPQFVGSELKSLRAVERKVAEWLDDNREADREAFKARHQLLLDILLPLEARMDEVLRQAAGGVSERVQADPKPRRSKAAAFFI